MLIRRYLNIILKWPQLLLRLVVDKLLKKYFLPYINCVATDKLLN